MPLLVCPNDSASMQTVQRNGVEFDFCPTCRGVWLDRGELEKLMSAVDGPREERPAMRRDEEYQRRDEDDRRREERSYAREYERPRERYDDDDDYRRGRRKRGWDLFDIFD